VAGSGGTYSIVITAANGASPNPTQSFTLTVNQALAITSLNSTTFAVGAAGSFSVTASGYPTPTFTESGPLPSGVTFSSAGVLSGTPVAGSGGTYSIVITAANGASPNPTQSFTLTVNQALPVVTGVSPSSGSVLGGTTVTITGMNLIDGFVTLDDPAGVNGTFISGISGNTIVGYYTDASYLDHGFVYSGSSFTTLDDPAGANGTQITGISGTTIVGSYEDSSGLYHGFEYNGSSFTTLDDPAGVSSGDTFVTGVSGETVIGYYLEKIRSGSVYRYISYGFIYSGSSFTSLIDAGDETIPTGISGGTIVGSYYPSSVSAEGFEYNGSSFTTVDDPAGDSTNGTVVNGIGGSTIVGDITDSAGLFGNGFVYNGSSFTALNDPAGVNGTYTAGVSGNTIVGYYEDSSNVNHGFVYNWATTVNFGSAAGTIVSVSATQIVATSPTETAGPVDVTVTTQGGTSSTSSAVSFSYIAAPSITSVNSTIWTVGTAGSISVVASGYPAPTFSESGPLPSGVTFSSTGLLSGTPAAGSGGIYSIVITAANGVASLATQTFTLTVNRVSSALSVTCGQPERSSGGVSAAFTAVVGSQNGVIPTGFVTFLDGSTALGFATLSNGTATSVSPALTAGVHLVEAIYSGDGEYAGSNATIITVVSSASNDVIRIAQDVSVPAEADVFIDSASVPTYSALFSSFSQWDVIGDAPDEQVIVDFSNGNPLPSGGLNVSGVSGNSGDDLTIMGTQGNDSVTATPNQIVVNGEPAINYSNVSTFQFKLGLGQDSLADDGASLTFNQNNAISSGTGVTVDDGGVLDLGGMSDSVSSLTLANGQISDGTLDSGVYVLESGTIDASLSGNGNVTKSGSGVVTLSGANSYTGPTSVTEGTLIIDVASGTPTIAPDATVSVSNAATLDLAGTISDLSTPGGNSATITNDSTAHAGILVTGTNQVVGSISGDGNVVVDPGSNITVDSVVQDTLSIGAGSTFTIAPSGPGIQMDATAQPTIVQTETDAAGASDGSSQATTTIQAAIASGSISSATGQQMENRIAAIEQLAKEDPGLDVSLLENRILSSIPTSVAPTTSGVATSSTDNSQSTGALPTVTVAAPVVNNAATPVATVEVAPADPVNATVQKSSPVSTVPQTTAYTTSSVITTASQPTYPPQPVAIVPSYPVVDYLLEADSLPASSILAASNNAAAVSASRSAFAAGRESLLNQLFQGFGEDMSGEDIHFEGSTAASFADISLGDTTVAGSIQVSQNTSRTTFEMLGIDSLSATSNGNRHASGGGRMDSDSVISDWSDEFLYAVSAFGDSSTEAD